MRNGFMVLSVSILAVLISCSQRPDDQAIVKDIQQKVSADPDTKDAEITVSSNEGKVTLKGKSTSPSTRPKVEKMAKVEPGVSAVDDEIAPEQPPLSAATEPVPVPVQAPPAHIPEPPKPKPEPQPVVIPEGSVFTTSLNQPLSSKTAQIGNTFTATLAEPVVIHGETVIPRGAEVRGKVLDAQSKGKIKGEARLVLATTGITVGGKDYPLHASMAPLTSKGKGKRTAATTGGGAAAGALIGGLAGGGKGAGIGALVGAGTGLVGGAFTGNKQIELPAESMLGFKLTAPLTIVHKSDPEHIQTASQSTHE